MNCNVCGDKLSDAVYKTTNQISVTSLCTILPIDTCVYFCLRCGHLQTPELVNINDYYNSDYKILVESEDEDQLYELVGSRNIFRSEHQAETLISTIQLPFGGRVLDYGCAKASTVRHLKKMRPDLHLHLFDVSEMYLPYWRKLTQPSCWATHNPRPEWLGGYFDLITSFFSLEHIAEPAVTCRDIAQMLVPGGRFYAVVPNWQENSADLVVVDHVNHFSPQSLARLIILSGLEIELISSELHGSALVVVARKADTVSSSDPDSIEDLAELHERVDGIAGYWSGFRDRVTDFEAEARLSGLRTAIYGSGFYGSYIATCLDHLEDVECFVDQNPFRQGHILLGKKVVAPEDLPREVEALYVGLNPAVARGELAKADVFRDKFLQFFLP